MNPVTEPADTQGALLFQRAAQGDLAAFDQLMQHYNQRMYRTARSILHDEADAEDVVQEAWWKAFNHLKTFRGDARPSTWLTRIVVNEALMRARRNKSRAAVIQSTTAPLEMYEAMHTPDEDDPTPTTTDSPDELVWRAELRGLIEQQIDALPDRYRSVFMLRGVEGLSSAGVAEILDVPEATVRVRYMRARRLLQEGLRRALDQQVKQAFSFAGERCDRIVAGVHRRMRAAGILKSD